MQTYEKSAKGGTAAQHDTTCAPCDIPAFCRSYFYTGKLLTERDLNSEQRYVIDKMRLHYVALHGWGVVCGLIVQPHPKCPDRFVVSPGFAIDECGREIRLLQEVVVMLPKPPQPASGEAYGDNPYQERAHEGHTHEKKTYYICLRYQESQEEYMTIPFEECCGTSKKPNRVCEGYQIDVVETAPDCLEEAHNRRHPHEQDCSKLYQTLTAECPKPAKDCCVPLAVIRSYHDSEPLTEKMIDHSVRPIVPSARLLEQLIHCALDRLPRKGPALTHIRHFNWEHDREYRPHEFLTELVGTYDAALGFEIEFDRRVHAGLNTRTFQAMLIREPMQPHEFRRVEIAPARVVRSDDGYRCVLQIDPEYARQHCHEHNFDLFITLRCDKVIDEHGLPVDGNLLGRLVTEQGEDSDYVVEGPTGDGVPGGLFESWIRVRRAR